MSVGEWARRMSGRISDQQAQRHIEDARQLWREADIWRDPATASLDPLIEEYSQSYEGMCRLARKYAGEPGEFSSIGNFHTAAVLEEEKYDVVYDKNRRAEEQLRAELAKIGITENASVQILLEQLRSVVEIRQGMYIPHDATGEERIGQL